MRTKIIKRAVDQLTPSQGKPILWDSELTGFGIRCRPSGAKIYILKTRIGGRQRWLTIGRHGSPWTPETARREALRLLGLKAAGNDPATFRDRQKGALTFAELAERFLTEYVPQHCKQRTAAEYRRALQLHINPVLGLQRISDVTRPDIARLHHRLRDKPYQANRCLAVLSKMMNLAEAWGLPVSASGRCELSISGQANRGDTQRRPDGRPSPDARCHRTSHQGRDDRWRERNIQSRAASSQARAAAAPVQS